MRLSASIFIPLLLSAALLFPALAVPSVQHVRIEGPYLSLEVKNQPLTAILDELTLAGIRILLDPKINPRVTASFENRPIGAALGSILRSYDFALIWAADRAAEAGELSLQEIQIFQKGQSGEQLPVYGGGNLVVEQDAAGNFHVKDTVLVQFDPAMTPSERRALLDEIGATLVDEYTPLGIVRLQLPPGSDVQAVTERLARLKTVQRAEPDYAYSLAGSRPVAESLSSAVPDTPSTVGSTTVAVLDSGLSGDYADGRFIEGAYDAVSSGALAGDTLGHGTQMTLIASGTVVPFGAESGDGEGTPVVAIRAFDDNGFTSDSALIRGIDYALASGAKVLSMSWGTEQSSTFLEAAMTYASDQGLIVVAAAGNTPSGEPVYPAAFETVIGVGALMPDGSTWSQSNYGSFVAVYAPGVADMPVGSDGSPGIYAGTSIATAYTARQIAAVLDGEPTADLSQVLLQLTKVK